MKATQLYLLLLLSCINVVHAQKPFFKNFSVSNGLPSSNAYYVTQDNNGYIWIATDAGVSRFDGKEFSTYTTRNGLTDNEVLQIHQDSSERLWFMTLNGKLSFYEHEQFFNEDSFHRTVKKDIVSFSYSLSEDKSGNVYTVISRGPVVKIGINDSIDYLYMDGYAKYHTWIYNDQLYVLSASGIYKINDAFTSYELLVPFNLNKHALRACTYNGNIIFAYGNDIYEYNSKNNALKLISALNNTYITSLTAFRNNEIWVGTKNGVLRFEDDTALKKGKYQRYLSGLTITSALLDREKNMWFTTLEEGVFFTPSIQITNYKNLLKESKVTSLFKDANNTLWIGSIKNNYAAYYNGQIKNYKLQINDREDEVANIYGSDNHNIWITSKTSILNVKYDSNRKIVDSRYLPYWANDVYITPNQNFWLGSSACWVLPFDDIEKNLSTTLNPRIINYNPKAKKVIQFTVNCFEKGYGNELYVGCKDGLYAINLTTTKVSSVHEKSEYLSGEITALKTFGNNRLLIGTAINGLIVLDADNNIKQTLALNKLSSNRIATIYVENDSTIWVGTYRGLDKIITYDDEYHVSNFTQEVGIGSITVNDIEIIDDDIFIGSNQGLIKVKKNIENKQVSPLVYISEISVDGKKTSPQNLKVKHSYNSFYVKLNAISFRDIESIKYYYKIEEQDKGWLRTYSPYINFASLSPGRYTIAVKAINALGIESDVKSIQFTILPPFWRTWWFYTSLLITTAVIIYIILHVKTKYMKRKFELERNNFRIEKERLELEKNLIELEQKTSRLQMNPHFIFNALNTIKSYYTDNQSDLGNIYTNKFAKLLRLILETEESFTTLDIEIEIITLYLELIQIRYNDAFSFNITMKDSIIPEELLVPSMLLQPFIENSVIHGIAPKKGHGCINVTFFQKQDMLYCVIDDDGIGRDAAAAINKNVEHISKATELVKSRLGMLSKNSKEKSGLIIEDKMVDGIATGTRVTITLPYKTI